jgi:hypothetical protein
MRKQETRALGPEGVLFEVTQLGLDDGIDALDRLSKVAAPVIARIADTPKGAKLALEPIVAEAVSKISAAQLQHLAGLFGKHTRFSVDGEKWPYLHKPQREELFAGDGMPLLFLWLAFAIEVNFAVFYNALGPVLGAAGPRATTPPPSEA